MALFFKSANEDQRTEMLLHMKRILHLLDFYKPLVDAYVSDFFVSELWTIIPKTWWDLLSTLEPEEMAYMLSPAPATRQRVWPLSLLAFRTSFHALALPRHPVCEEKLSQLLQNKIKEHHCDSKKTSDCNSLKFCVTPDEKKSLCDHGAPTTESWTSAQDEIRNGQYRLLQHCYRRHVKPKKQHEITRLAETIDTVCSDLDLHHVVDVGAGQGHLSRLLSFGYGHTVTTVEAAGGHAPKAEKFDSEVTLDVAKGRLVKAKERKKQRQQASPELDDKSNKVLAEMMSSPTHVVGVVSPDVSVEEFLNTLQFTPQTGCPKLMRNEGLVGESRYDQGSGISRSCSHRNSSGESSSITTCQELQATCEDTGTCQQSKNAQQFNQNTPNRDVPNQRVKATSNQSLFVNENFLNAQGFVGCYTCGDNGNASSDSKHSNGIGVDQKCKSCDSTSCSEHAQHVSLFVDDLPYTLEITIGESLQIGDKSNPEELSGGVGQATANVSSCAHISLSKCAEGPQVSDAVAKTPSFLLTGLHACGDLTPTMLCVFVKCPQARALASVGCCYMKMTRTGSEASSMIAGSCGYPMSHGVQQMPWPTLSWEALEMGCHFMEEYHQRLLDNGPSLKSHVYRSALQEIIRDKDPSIIHGSVKLTLKKTYQLPFQQYAEKALGRLNLDPSLTEAQLSRAQSRLQTWRSIVAFYALRLSMAPLVETVVLLDRVLYLMEQGIDGCLVPIFDPSLSPRNFVLLAWKR